MSGEVEVDRVTTVLPGGASIVRFWSARGDRVLVYEALVPAGASFGITGHLPIRVVSDQVVEAPVPQHVEATPERVWPGPDYDIADYTWTKNLDGTITGTPKEPAEP